MTTWGSQKRDPEHRWLDRVVQALNGEGYFSSSEAYETTLRIMEAQRHPITSDLATSPEPARMSSATHIKDGDRRVRNTLRKYVDSWLRVKPNFVAWKKQNRELAADLDRALENLKLFLEPVRKEKEARKLARERHLGRFDRRGARLTYRFAGNPEDHAAQLFLDLVTSPRCDDVGFCLACKRYYVNASGHRNKLYCSRRCASRECARRGMEDKRKTERDEKIQEAKRLIDRWSRSGGSTDWKRWICSQGRNLKVGVTLHWLTRAVNSGWLKPPKKSLRREK